MAEFVGNIHFYCYGTVLLIRNNARINSFFTVT
jgi:hypothetical protein